MRKHTISFKNAFTGIYTAVVTQANMRIHFMAATIVFLLSVYLKVTLIEGLILIVATCAVVICEIFNTSLEFLADAVTLDKNEYIKNAKDVSAGGVLIAAIFALVIGAIIFIPKILAL